MGILKYKGTCTEYAKIEVTDMEVLALPKHNLQVGKWQTNYHIPVSTLEYDAATNRYKTPASGWYTPADIIRYIKINAMKLLPTGTKEISYDAFSKIHNSY